MDGTLSIEVWLVVDENGDYALGKAEDEAAERYADDVGADESVSKRRVKITLAVPTPKPAELTATVPPEPEVGALKVAG